MKILKVLFFVFFLPINAQGDALYYLLKIPDLKLQEIDKNNNLRYLLATKSFKVGIRENSVTCESAGSNLVDKKNSVIKESTKIYDKLFLKKINLKYIVICKDMTVASIPALGVPNHPLKTIIININTNDYNLTRTIHHEIFHIINRQYPEKFDSQIWKKFNEKSFKYSKCSPCDYKNGLSIIQKNDGFLSQYSKKNVSEDMAEVYSFLMSKSGKIQKDISEDKILKKKVDYIKTKIFEIDNIFSFSQ